MKLNNWIYSLVTLSILAACDDPKEESQPVETPVEVEKLEEEVVETKPYETSEVDFFTVCDNLELWKGGIQGVPSSDSTGPYIMGQCFGDAHFDIIVYAEKDVELSDAVINHKDLNTSLEGVSYFAFEIPKVTKENPEDEFDLYDYVYPSEVKVYKNVEGEWRLINTKEVSSFEELGQLKLESIYL